MEYFPKELNGIKGDERKAIIKALTPERRVQIISNAWAAIQVANEGMAYGPPMHLAWGMFHPAKELLTELSAWDPWR